MNLILEGVDGVGKSTVAKMLAKMLANYNYIHFPTKHKEGLELCFTPYSPAPFILDILAYTPKDNAIIDRWLFSTSAYNGADIRSIVPYFLQNSKVAFLDAPIGDCIDRLIQCDHMEGYSVSDMTDRLGRVRNNYYTILSEYTYNKQVKFFQVEHKSPEEVAKEVLEWFLQ